MDFEDVFLAQNVLQNLNEAEVAYNRPRRQVLHSEDPFNLADNRFKKLFRLTKDSVREVIERVRPYIPAPTRESALSVETKVFAALKFFGFGSYQEITGSNIYIGIAQSSVSNSLNDVSKALSRPEILNEYVKFPGNMQELEDIRNRFYQKYEFPGIIGVIDCTHVAIVSPHTFNPDGPEYLYVNRKNYHSLNVQLICDENLRIMNVNAKFPGSSHDSYIWRQSPVSGLLEQLYRNNPNNPLFLFGDSGYPLRPWLLTPLHDVDPDSPEGRFNKKFCTIRSLIEQCNGLLKNRFRCLLRHRVLHYHPEKAGLIVNACCVLHNICIDNNIPQPDRGDLVDPDWGMYDYHEPREEENRGMGIVNPDLVAARQLQRRIIRNHFQ